MSSLPTHYAVPGQGTMGFICDLLDRDSDVETPAQAFMRGNALKYLVRAPRKGGVEDYKKAADYIGRLIESLEVGQ